jgi:hypothetical protein
MRWSSSAQFAMPKELRVNFGENSLKIMIHQWDIDSGE